MNINEYERNGMKYTISQLNRSEDGGKKRLYPRSPKRSFINGCAIGAMCAPAVRYALRIIKSALLTLEYGYGPPDGFFIVLGIALFPPLYLVMHYAFKGGDIKDACWNRIMREEERRKEESKTGKEDQK